MPHKFNASRRHKFDKAQYRVINWAEYNESLRQRGDLTIWVSEEAQSVWSAPRRTSRGGQGRYSDLAMTSPEKASMVKIRTSNPSGGAGGTVEQLAGVRRFLPSVVLISALM